MQPPLAHHRTALSGGSGHSTREGRDCELSRRLTTLLLFPRLDATPGAWLLLLTAVCSFVAVRALELGAF